VCEPEGLPIPGIKVKKAKEAVAGALLPRLFRSGVHAPDGCQSNGDKGIHGQKNPHECGGTLPACPFGMGVMVFICEC